MIIDCFFKVGSSEIRSLNLTFVWEVFVESKVFRLSLCRFYPWPHLALKSIERIYCGLNFILFQDHSRTNFSTQLYWMLPFFRNLFDCQTILDLGHQFLLRFRNLGELRSAILEAYSEIKLQLLIEEHHFVFKIFLFQVIWFANERKECKLNPNLQITIEMLSRLGKWNPFWKKKLYPEKVLYD